MGLQVNVTTLSHVQSFQQNLASCKDEFLVFIYVDAYMSLGMYVHMTARA